MSNLLGTHRLSAFTGFRVLALEIREYRAAKHFQRPLALKLARIGQPPVLKSATINNRPALRCARRQAKGVLALTAFDLLPGCLKCLSNLGRLPTSVVMECPSQGRARLTIIPLNDAGLPASSADPLGRAFGGNG